MQPFRRLATALPRTSVARFHASTRARVEIGQSLPDIELQENSPGTKVSLAKELATGKGVIVGIPAAFSPSCSATHIPGYINSPQLSRAGPVFVVAVNDVFVTSAWRASLSPPSNSPIRFLADPSGAFTEALDLAFSAPQIFGHPRSKRYALLIEDGKVKQAFVEPDNTGVNVSAAEKVLK